MIFDCLRVVSGFWDPWPAAWLGPSLSDLDDDGCLGGGVFLVVLRSWRQRNVSMALVCLVMTLLINAAVCWNGGGVGDGGSISFSGDGVDGVSGSAYSQYLVSFVKRSLWQYLSAINPVPPRQSIQRSSSVSMMPSTFSNALKWSSMLFRYVFLNSA